MKRLAGSLLGILIIVAMAAPAFAQSQPQPQLYPNVSNLEPFSAASNFMSLAGYLRWLVFQEKSEWLSMAEAQRIVSQSSAAGQ